MEKRLPYFKFEPSKWGNGDIQLCSREAKGLFIDVCSVYWSKLGKMKYAFALQKLCNGNKEALQELIDNEVMEVREGLIYIEFLSIQLVEFEDISESRSKAARKRWETKTKDTKAMQMHNKASNGAMLEEKRIEEKSKAKEIREEKSKEELKSDLSIQESPIDVKEVKKEIPQNGAIEILNGLDTKKEKKKPSADLKKKEGVTKILEIFKEVTGKNIDVTIKGNRDFVEKIYSRIKTEKVTPRDIEGIVVMKQHEWQNDYKKKKWIRVSTIFGNKFWKYLEEYRLIKDDELAQEEFKQSVDGGNRQLTQKEILQITIDSVNQHFN